MRTSRQELQCREEQLQALPARPEQVGGALDGTRRLRDLLGVGAGELLRTDEIARDYRFPSAEAVRKYLTRHQVPYLTRGRIVLVDRRDFETSMSKARKIRLSKAS